MCCGPKRGGGSLIVSDNFAQAAADRIEALREEVAAIVRLVGDATAWAAQLHTEAQRVMARNEGEFGAAYCALCDLRDRISALQRVKDSTQDGICVAHSPGSTTTRPDGGAISPEKTC